MKISFFIKEKLNKNIGNVISILVFFCVISGLSVSSILCPDRTFSKNENRVLKTIPKISISGILDGSFEKDFEEYTNDQIVLRDNWINIKTKSELLMQKKDINGVYIGEGGYLIEMHTDIDETLLHQNEEALISFIGQCNTKFGKENVHVMLVPTASLVLEDYITKSPEEFNQNELIDYMKSSLNENFIDVRDELTEHKNDYIYYKTDHHWTSFGAFIAYKKWAKECNVVPYEEADFNVENFSDEFLGTLFSKVNFYKAKDSIDIYKLGIDLNYTVDINDGAKVYDTMFITSHKDEKDKYSVFLDGNNPIVKINTQMDNDKTLLVIKDSYAHCFVPFVANHYKNIVMVDLRYLKKPLSQVIEENHITDVLILYNAAQFAKDSNICFISR